MNRVARALCILVMLSSIGTIHAQDEGKPDTKDKKARKADPALVEAGKVAAKSIKPITPGTTFESYFDITMGPGEIVGYVAVTVEVKGTKEKPFYLYTTETGNRFPNGSRFKAVVNAKMSPSFEPIEIDMARTVTDRKGEQNSDLQHAKLMKKDKKVALTAQKAGSEPVEREEVLPEPPYIYGIETVVQFIDFDVHKKFILREFDMATGKAGTMTFTADVWKDGTTTVLVTDPPGNVTYQFWYDDDGKLLRWGVPTMPIMFVTSSKANIDRMRHQF